MFIKCNIYLYKQDCLELYFLFLVVMFTSCLCYIEQALAGVFMQNQCSKLRGNAVCTSGVFQPYMQIGAVLLQKVLPSISLIRTTLKCLK